MKRGRTHTYKPKRRGTLRSAISRALLEFVCEAAKTSVTAVNLYSFFLNYQRAILRHGTAYARELEAIHTQADLKRRLRELQRQRYITSRKIGKRIELRLTNQGQLATRLQALSLKKNGGMVATIIIFDVPETERAIRRELRQLLKQVKFKRLQQSAWVRSADVYAEARDLVSYLKVSRWVIVVRTTDPIGR